MHRSDDATRPDSGPYRPEHPTPARRVTISDVARHAGVSKSAVSFALNDRPGVSPGTRARIRGVARSLGFTPSTRARALSSSRAFAFGLVIARPARLLAADPFYPEFLAGVEGTLAKHGIALLLHMTEMSPEAEAAGYTRLHDESRVDGVLLTDLRRDDLRFALVRSLRIPAVAVGEPNPPQESVPTVVVDDRVGISAAVRHLADLGHRVIGHVSGPGRYVHSLSRRAAWRATLRDLGLPPGPAATGDFTGPGGAAATRRLLAKPRPPTAIVYANDLMAAAGMAAARQVGLDIPGELSVVGFDDAPLSTHLHPALSSVRSDAEGWGRAAAAVLVDLASGGTPADVVLGPPHLVIRDSTAPPASVSATHAHRRKDRPS